ncbi:MAG: hypothetical protein B6D61_04855 [Bacteroidetes bacterium 4484_249]|nr:MAG: hypothetical protein B6D61_04855 [Bacteroidetes bacterium 4484_249]
MKKAILTLTVAVAICFTSFGQAPDGFTYQAVIRDAANTVLINLPVGIQLTILQGGASGNAVYTETFSHTTNAYGLVNLEVGTGSTSGDFSTIDWTNGPYFIETAVDITGGTSYSVMGVSQLLSVPYALHAKTSESVTGTIAETDPIFGASVAGGITAMDTSYWNNKLGIEVDGSLTNEIQNIHSVLIEGNDAGLNSLTNIGRLTIGSTDETPGAALEINSVQGALLLPRMTTNQRNALTPVEGMMIYNTTERKFQGYCGFDTTILAYSSIGLTDAYVYDDGFIQDYPAQSFQVSEYGILDSLSFWVAEFYNGFISDGIYIEVYSGLPNTPETFLAYKYITINSTGKYTISFDEAPLLSTNTDYFFVIKPTMPFKIGWLSVLMSNGATPGEHPYGSLWYFDCDMVEFEDSQTEDLKFEIISGTNGPSWTDLH